MITGEVAHRMFVRDIADPALTELAWVDPGVRHFWRAQAEAVPADFAELTGASRDRSADSAMSRP